METILNLATTEKRARTEDESTKWKNIDTEVRNLTAEIETLERQAELNRQIAGQKDLDKRRKRR